MKTESKYIETPKIGWAEKFGFGTFSTASNVVFNFVARSDLCVYSGDDFLYYSMGYKKYLEGVKDLVSSRFGLFVYIKYAGDFFRVI